MAETEQQQWYRVLAPDGLWLRTSDDDDAPLKHIRTGRVVPRETFNRVDWLLKDGLIERADAPDSPAASPATGDPSPEADAADSSPPHPPSEPDGGEAA